MGGRGGRIGFTMEKRSRKGLKGRLEYPMVINLHRGR